MGCHLTKLSCTVAGTVDCIRSTNVEAELVSAYVEARRLMPELHHRRSLHDIKFRKSVLRNQDLTVLAMEYLNSAALSARLLSALKLWLSGARRMQAFVGEALECNEKEAALVVNNRGTRKYPLTLSKLRVLIGEVVLDGNLPAFEDLHSTVDFASLRVQQLSIDEKLSTMEEETREKLRSANKWKKAFKVLWNAAFVLVLVLSVVLAAMGAPAFATVAASAGCTAIKTAEQWLNAVWEGRTKALEEIRDAVAAMTEGEFGAGGLRETVLARVMKLEIDIKSLLALAGFAVERGEEEGMAVEVAVEEMMRNKVVKITGEGIHGVEASIDACVGEIQKMVAQIMAAIAVD